jgi:tetratricopeptide (TPR) repeat protein
MARDLEQRSHEWKAHIPKDSEVAHKRAAVFRENLSEAHNALGALYQFQRKLQSAAAQYAQALLANTRHCPARHNLAVLYREHGSELRCISPHACDPFKLLRQNTIDCADFEPSWLYLARTSLEQGLQADAKQAYRRVLELAPDNAEALSGMGAVLETEGDLRAAAEHYQAALNAYEKRLGVARPLAPASAYIALARTLEAQHSGNTCDLYVRAAAAMRLMPHTREEQRFVKKKVSLCASSGR